MTRTAQWAFSLAVFLLLFLTFTRPARPADDWLPITPDDLGLKDNSKQAGADAMVLYREVSVDAKGASVNNYLRIKIFTQAGVKQQADIELPYDKAQESIQAIRGRTIHPDGKIVDFEGKGFDKEIVKGGGIKYLAKTFTLPDVQQGSIIEYRYREQYDDRYYWTLGWTVQYNLFTRLARFSIKPDDSTYSLPLYSRSYNLPPDVAKVQKQGNLYTLEIHDLPGIESEELMPPERALQAKVEFYYRDADEPTSETPEQYWKRMGRKWNDQVDRFVDKKKELAAEVAQDVSPSDTPEVKLKKLYDRTLKIRNLDFEDDKTSKEQKQEQIKPNNNAEDVLKHGYGHFTEINFLLIGLARAAGFEAADIRAASRNDKIFYPQREAASDLGTELIWVRPGSKEYYLDPAARFYSFGVLPWFETAANGLRVSKDGGEMILTPPPVSANATIVRHADLTVSNTMEVSGKVQIDFTGEEASLIRRDSRDEDAGGRKKVLEDEVRTWLPVGSTFEISDIVNWDDVEQPLHVEGTVKVPSFANGAVQRMLIPLEVFQATEVSLFKSQQRVNEVDFPYSYDRTDDLVIHTPKGYKVQAVPNAQTVNPGPVLYEISVTQQADSVEVKRHFVLNATRYPKESYPALRAFFSAMRTDDNAQVMLQNTQSVSNN